ncbi:MAG: hypothetical protein Q9203_004658 [Teloschistes exilis]
MARPLSGVWDLTQNKILYDYSTAQLFSAAFIMALDLATLYFPLPVISKLRMKTKQKVLTIGIFWLGALCSFDPQMLWHVTPGLGPLQGPNLPVPGKTETFSTST